MKKNGLLKAISIAFLVYALLSWIIPTGSFSSGVYTDQAFTPIGIFDFVRYPLITSTSSIFILTALVILLIGGLYGVLNKTGAYQNLIDATVKKFKKKETMFLVITVIVFALLSSLTALTLPLFIMVPFFATVILLFGYSKFTAMLSTVGAILSGNLASICGFNIAGYITYLTNDMTDSIIYRIILFIAVTALLIMTVVKSSKTKEKVKIEEIVLYDKSDKSKKSFVSLMVISLLTVVLILVGMFNWTQAFGIDFFDNVHTSIIEFEIGGYPLFGNLIGAIYGMGSWTNYELGLTIIVSALLIGWVYKLKFKDTAEAFVSGAKKMLPVAVYSILANILFLLMNSTSDGYTIFATIANGLLSLASGFNIITFGLTSFIGSILYNDFPYLLSVLYDPITNLYTDSYSIIGIITQSIHGLVQLIAPTSIILVMGLKFFEIPYTEWLRKIVKFVLLILAIVVILIIIMTLI